MAGVAVHLRSDEHLAPRALYRKASAYRLPREKHAAPVSVDGRSQVREVTAT